MIDIISSSIRLGKLLKEHDELKRIFDFFLQVANEKSNPYAYDYIKLVTAKFGQYGLYAFDVVDKILVQNFENADDFAQRMAKEIYDYITAIPNYNDILVLSQKYGAVLETYISELIKQKDDYPQIKISNVSVKIQQCSNELSTAILRSGVFIRTSDHSKMKVLENEMSFIKEYEKQTIEYTCLHPYNKKVKKIMHSLNANQKKMAYFIENIKFVKYLSRCGILQGFFFELFDIPDTHILKIKEMYKEKSIHPIVIETDLIYPNNHLFLFRYSYDGRVSYLLARRMTIKFAGDKAPSTTLFGYCYPTNEYSLLRID